MEEAPSFQAYRASPAGRAWRGEGWRVFCARAGVVGGAPGLWGFAVAGAVGGDAAIALVDALRLELEPDVAPHRSLIDARHLTAVEPRSFSAFSRYVETAHARLAAQVQALAIVRPPGLEGAVVAGFFQLLPPPYPVFVVDSVDAGLVALGEDVAALAGLRAFLDDIGGDQLLTSRLRALCRQQPLLELDDAARALAVSTRTLQRRLREAGTSFSDVVADARLQEARARIEGSDAPLTTIALDAGFSSLQHLGQATRKAFGLSPSALRARARARGRPS
jgi:AraC-like DNA-binding protein